MVVGQVRRIDEAWGPRRMPWQWRDACRYAYTRVRGSVPGWARWMSLSHGKHHSSVEARPAYVQGWAAMMMVRLLSCARTAFNVRYAASPPSATTRKGSGEPPGASIPTRSGIRVVLTTTVSSVPDQLRFASSSAIARDSPETLIARQKSTHRATASSGGHDTSNTVMRRRRKTGGFRATIRRWAVRILGKELRDPSLLFPPAWWMPISDCCSFMYRSWQYVALSPYLPCQRGGFREGSLRGNNLEAPV